MRRLACRVLTALAAAAVLLGAACGGDAPAGTDAIARETFVETWVDLRKAALESADGTLDPADREAVLARHGVTEDDLLRFAEVHGGNVELMRVVWSEVEERLEDPAPADSAS